MRRHLFVIAAVAAAVYHLVDGAYAWSALLLVVVALVLGVHRQVSRAAAAVAPGARRLSVGSAVAPGSVAPRRG